MIGCNYTIPVEYGAILASDGSAPPPPGAPFNPSAEKTNETALGRVLVVDDERLIADTVAQILNIHGYDAFTAYSGADALKLIDRFRPDYLLTDVMMPVMNGIDLAAAVEKLMPSVKIMLFSGQAGTSALLQNQRKGGVNFPIIAKPIHPERLVEALRELGTAQPQS